MSAELAESVGTELWTSPGAAAQRPPRLLLTMLGDYWWQRTEPLPSAAIVALLAEFGVSDSAARAALSRLTRNGLLVTSKTGRRRSPGSAPAGRRRSWTTGAAHLLLRRGQPALGRDVVAGRVLHPRGQPRRQGRAAQATALARLRPAVRRPVGVPARSCRRGDRVSQGSRHHHGYGVPGQRGAKRAPRRPGHGPGRPARYRPEWRRPRLRHPGPGLGPGRAAVEVRVLYVLRRPAERRGAGRAGTADRRADRQDAGDGRVAPGFPGLDPDPPAELLPGGWPRAAARSCSSGATTCWGRWRRCGSRQIITRYSPELADRAVYHSSELKLSTAPDPAADRSAR